MKVGDKVLCKKDYKTYGFCINTKGQLYTILTLSKTDITVSTNYTDDSLKDKNFFMLYDEGTLDEGRFSFNYYFYTQKEYRKLKIQKLQTL